MADRWEAEAAEHVRLGAQYRTDRNDRLAAWAMSHADACHWHAATLRERVVHHTSGKDAWRSGSSAFMSCVTPGEYLKWLAAQGYPLSPGEEVITGDRTADAVYDEQSSADGKE